MTKHVIEVEYTYLYTKKVKYEVNKISDFIKAEDKFLKSLKLQEPIYRDVKFLK